ncbi:MAG: hypothetical protein ACJA02_000895 [Myxococcota bacterium]|jgi:hypothetical protein
MYILFPRKGGDTVTSEDVGNNKEEKTNSEPKSSILTRDRASSLKSEGRGTGKFRVRHIVKQKHLIVFYKLLKKQEFF